MSNKIINKNDGDGVCYRPSPDNYLTEYNPKVKEINK